MISSESDKMDLYPFQKRVYELISAGQSVILQAPTGAGKTRAALYPFLRSWAEGADFPRKCVYSVPMRVLANQFYDEFEGLVRRYGWQRDMDVTIQTGARPEDPKLEGNLIFTTIDQTLSNFLNIPYALSLRQGNLNAGAIASSYLVFDELHLFDPETTLPTTLHLLRSLRGIVPFLVMTATFSTDRVKALAKDLGAEALVLTTEEAAAIPSQQKTRHIGTVDGLLTAGAVLARHQTRSIAICNTVNRAQALYEDLCQRKDADVQVRLLHSRFLRSDRDTAEAWLRREFGKDKSQYIAESAILVATQVIEVGVDITSEALHTEIAPAASVIQRAGRCARYRDEAGEVFVYRVPPNAKGEPNYAPYHSSLESRICELTWQALQNNDARPCDFGGELAIVDQAHGEADRAMIDKWRATRGALAARVADTVAAQERGAAAELIRQVDSRTVIVHPAPEEIENPWALDGFGIFRGSLLGAYDDLEALADQAGEPWIMMTAEPVPEDEESQTTRTIWRWRHIRDKQDLPAALLVAVNPALARYRSDMGFQLGVPGDPNWCSPPRERTKRRESYPPYRRETIVEHVSRMMRVYQSNYYDHGEDQKRLALADEVRYATNRLEQRSGWPAGALDRLTRLAIAVHDLGKLDVRWQGWAHRWQAEVSKLRRVDLTIAENYLAAHTDYDSQNEAERALNYKLGRLRPNHAAESAAAAVEALLSLAGDAGLARAVLTAIIAHHGAGAKGAHGAFRAHRASPQVVEEILREAELQEVHAGKVIWTFPEGEELVNRKVHPNSDAELLAYLLIVRTLRMADQRSQESM